MKVTSIQRVNSGTFYSGFISEYLAKVPEFTFFIGGLNAKTLLLVEVERGFF